METQRVDNSETSGDTDQRASVGGTNSAESSESEPDDENRRFVSENHGLGADENLASSTADIQRREPIIENSDPVRLTNAAGAGNGLKQRPRLFKKSGKKLVTRSSNPKKRSFLQFGSKTQDIRRPVKNFRRRGPSYNFESDDADIKTLLEKHTEVQRQYKKQGKGPMEAFSDFRRDYWYLLCNGIESVDGPVQGVRVGMCFTWRTELFLVGLHHRIQAGIDFIPAERSPVSIDGKPVHIAVSVVVTGNFEDDVDEGEKILYCGEGGRPYVGAGRGEQAAHQTLTRGNLALSNSAKLGRAIRVIRKHQDDSSPSGCVYSYDGMYKVSRSFTQWGKGGYRVYMYELNRLPNQGELRW